MEGEGASLPRSAANHFVFSSALKNTEVFNALSVVGEWKCSFLRLRFVHELLIRLFELISFITESLFSTLDVNLIDCKGSANKRGI